MRNVGLHHLFDQANFTTQPLASGKENEVVPLQPQPQSTNNKSGDVKATGKRGRRPSAKKKEQMELEAARKDVLRASLYSG